MTDKQQLQGILSSIDYHQNRIAFLCYWLEDINFHTECRKISELATERENKLEEDLHALYMIANERRFRLTHWNSIKDSLHSIYDYDTLVKYLDKIREDKEGVAMSTYVSWRMFSDYLRAVDLSYALAKIWGYGSSLNYEELLECLEVCKKEDEEKVRLAEAYSRYND